MSYQFDEGSGKTAAADVIGNPAVPTTAQQVPWVKLDSGAAGSSSPVNAANPLPVELTDGTHTTPAGDAAARPIYTVGPQVVNPSANFSRPADTTAYTSGDLVANSTTAGSVNPMSFTLARVATGNAKIKRARLKKSGTVVTNATFRLHLYAASPTPANGDNGVWSTTESTYLGSFDLDMTAATGRVFTDAAEVIAGPSVGTELNVALASGQAIFGLLEARAAYTPASGETFTVTLEAEQN